MIRFIERLEKLSWFLPLVFILFVFFLLRLPSLFEPYWYGDEGIYHVLGRGLREGRMLYSGVWDNKPPLLYFVYALFNADQFWIRLSSVTIGGASVVFFFFLSQKLFHKDRLALVTTSLYAFLFALPLLEGTIANAENFMLLPVIIAMLLVFLQVTQQKRKLYLFSAGLLFSIAFLFKVVAIFDLASALVFLVFIELEQKEPFIKLLKNSFLLLGSFLIPIVIACAYFLLANNFSSFFSAAFQQNIGYVGYGNTFFITQGLLLIKLLGLLTFLLALFFVRKKLSISTQFILIWLSFSLFNAFFSQRPYTHYLLVLLPSMSLLFGLIWYTRNSRIYFEQKFLPFTFTLLLLFLGVVLYKNFWIQKKVIPYYQNFLLYITGFSSTDAYRGFFDKSTLTDYELADFLNTTMKSDDTLFVWGNNAQLYILTDTLPPGRFAVAYHMTHSKETLEETRKDLANNNPSFIVITSANNPFPFSLAEYRQIAKIRNATVYKQQHE